MNLKGNSKKLKRLQKMLKKEDKTKLKLKPKRKPTKQKKKFDKPNRQQLIAYAESTLKEKEIYLH